MSEEPGPTVALDAWSALVDVYQGVLHEVVSDLEARAQMDSGMFSALAYLARARPAHRMPMGALQLAMYPRYSQPGFSRLIQRMESEGLVDRIADPNDRRATIVATTTPGRARYRRAKAVYEASLQTHFARHLPAARGQELMQILAQVTASRAELTRESPANG